jgi:hypothetical protein
MPKSITSKFKGTRSRKEILARIEEIEVLLSAHRRQDNAALNDRLLGAIGGLRWALLDKNYLDDWQVQIARGEKP